MSLKLGVKQDHLVDGCIKCSCHDLDLKPQSCRRVYFTVLQYAFKAHFLF